MNEIDLKPCPFCGGDIEIVNSGGDKRIDCKQCGARSDWYDTIAEAADAWNKRAWEAPATDIKLQIIDGGSNITALTWATSDGREVALKLGLQVREAQR